MLRVLVVEDEEMIRKGIVLATDWQSLGCVVVGEAANGEEGILQAEACKPSLIITDLKMPKMDGLEMISRLREAGCEAYVIILTAYDSFTYAQTAIRLGAVDFLLKPFHDGDLENAVLALQKRIAGQKKRVLETIRFSTLGAAVFSLLVWAVFMLFPEPLIRIFTPDEALITVAVRAVRIYFCGFVFMSLQFVAQNSFRSLGKARQAIFFSLLRKIVLVVPLMLLLPGVFGLGADGVYWSEPISDLLGGGAAFTTLMLTVYRPLAKELKEETLCQN